MTVAGPLGSIVQKCTKTNVRRRYSNVITLREKLFEVLREKISFSSREEEELVKLLQQKNELSDEEWDRVFQQIDENEEKDHSNHAIFSALTTEQLEQLATGAPDLFASLGKDYAKYAKGTFSFDYCDVIATRAEVFYNRGEQDLKAVIALALLELGTTHNRWFVERKFVQMARPSISDQLAQQIATEIDVQDYDFSFAIGRLERSIHVSRNDLHPVLAKKAGEEE